jgi:hypothetical protein
VALSIDNVDRTIVEAVRTVSSPPTASLSVVLASDPDTVEAGPFELTIREVQYDALVVTATMAVEDILNEPFPGDLFTPQNFPGLF